MTGERRTGFEDLSRNGLAPVEMVLALPLLMGVMGLLMVFGFVASWKVRSEVVARDIGWRVRNPRSVGLHQRSAEWPELEGSDRHLGLSTQGGGRLESVDAQAIVHAPIIRGPLPEIDVNNNLLDMSRGVVRGISTVNQPSQVMGEIGRVDYQTRNDLLSEELKYGPMGVWNFARRIPVLWNTELDVLYDNQDISNLIYAINELRDPVVMPIDEDMEFYTWNLRLLDSRHIDEFGNETFVWKRWDDLPVWPDPESYRYIRDYSALGESDWDSSRQSPVPFPRPNRGQAPMVDLDVNQEVVKWQYYELGQQKIRESIAESFLFQIPQRPLSMAMATRRLYETVLDYSTRDLVEPRLTLQEKNQLEAWVKDLDTYITELQERE